MPDKRSAFNVKRFGKHEPLDSKRLPVLGPVARPIPLLPLSRFLTKIIYVTRIIPASPSFSAHVSRSSPGTNSISDDHVYADARSGASVVSGEFTNTTNAAFGQGVDLDISCGGGEPAGCYGLTIQNLRFDTSTLPDTAIIVSAALTVDFKVFNSPLTSNPGTTIQARRSAGRLASSWIPGDILNTVVLLATTPVSGLTTSFQTRVLTNVGTELACYINLTGNTDIVLDVSNLVDNVAPAVIGANHSGYDQYDTQNAVLTVVYTLP